MLIVEKNDGCTRLSPAQVALNQAIIDRTTRVVVSPEDRIDALPGETVYSTDGQVVSLPSPFLARFQAAQKLKTQTTSETVYNDENDNHKNNGTDLAWC